MTCNSSVIKFLFICFLFFLVFCVFFWFPEGGSQGLENIFFLIAPTFFILCLPMNAIFWSPFLLFWASDFLWNSHWLLCLYTFPLSTWSDFFQLPSVSHPMHNFEFCLFYECVTIRNSESMSLPQSFGCLLLPSVLCTFSCNADRESVDAVQDRIRGTPQLTILWDPKATYFAYLQQKMYPLVSWGPLKLFNDI